ncbi:hypothetical protein GOBAR_AA19298 [Gossypium barbadense]|uniref:Uncharacterized protein n=1 Tax=Gossypium barbadense TaxID=3634 RepID=A0A2P5XDG1_GOSBA|nr:hypothetical protein GOBAR_AA19298 [Gossypium barbadense]
MAYHAWFIGPVSTSSSTTPTRFHGSYDGSRPLGSSWESGELRFNDDGVMFDAAVDWRGQQLLPDAERKQGL